jgi:hypothetical protein
MAKSCDLPMQPIVARAGFVAEPQSLTASLAQVLDKLADVIGAVQKIAKLTYFPTARPTGNRDRNRRFVDIHSHEDGIVHQVRPPCLRLCAGLSTQSSNGTCRGTDRQMLHTADIESRGLLFRVLTLLTIGLTDFLNI